jgi:DNA-binding NarL/FixJ family response regulator
VRQSVPEVKVLVLTGQTEDEYIMRALRAGAHGYILKTTEENALVQAVRDVLKGHLVLGHGVAERVAQRYVTRPQAEDEPAYDELARAVLVGIAAGLSNDQIAERLHLAPPIVDRQVKELLERLRASSRIEAAMIALRQGVIHLDDIHTMLA